jgi:cytochrome P450
VMDLPYLDAVIRETMRLMPVIPGMSTFLALVIAKN